MDEEDEDEFTFGGILANFSKARKEVQKGPAAAATSALKPRSNEASREEEEEATERVPEMSARFQGGGGLRERASS